MEEIKRVKDKETGRDKKIGRNKETGRDDERKRTTRKSGDRQTEIRRDGRR